MRDAGLVQRVALEPGQRIDADVEGALAQHPVAGDACVEDGHLRAARLRHQPRGQIIRPAMIRVWRRAGAVGNRVAKGDHGADRLGRHHLHSREEEPRGRRRDNRQGGHPGVIAGLRNVIGLKRTVVHRERRRCVGVAGQVQIDRQIRECRNVEFYRIAVHHREWRNGDGGPPAEGQRAIGRRHDRRCGVAPRDVRRADGERGRPEGVAQYHARPIAADARVHDLTQGLVVEVHERRRRGRRWRG